MAKSTSIEDVEEAVAAVGVMQDQIARLLEAMTRLTFRVEMIEKRLPRGGEDV